MEFESKVALVTGGGSGIGAAVARTLAKRGAAVVVADLASDAGESVAAEIRSSGGEATFIRTDVTNVDDVDGMVQFAVDTYGRLDLAHNNAGIVHAAIPLHELELSLFERVMDVNTRSVFLCLQAEIRHFLTAGGGSIVNTASGAGLGGAATLSAYVASKHAVVGLTRTAAAEYYGSGIRVNAVAPATVESPMTAGMTKEQREQLNANLRGMKRMGTTQEIASAVAFLLSDEASYITGEVMTLDGGHAASF